MHLTIHYTHIRRKKNERIHCFVDIRVMFQRKTGIQIRNNSTQNFRFSIKKKEDNNHCSGDESVQTEITYLQTT